MLFLSPFPSQLFVASSRMMKLYWAESFWCDCEIKLRHKKVFTLVINIWLCVYKIIYLLSIEYLSQCSSLFQQHLNVHKWFHLYSYCVSPFFWILMCCLRCKYIENHKNKSKFLTYVNILGQYRWFWFWFRVSGGGETLLVLPLRRPELSTGPG